jgi:hypothetical protein
MAAPPSTETLAWLSRPSLIVNLFGVKRQEPHGDRYLVLPANSFQLPGEGALPNADVDPSLAPYEGVDTERDTFVLKGVAFVAWPARLPSVTNQDGLEVRLFEFQSVPCRFLQFAGRRLQRVEPGPHPHRPHPLPSFSAPVVDPYIPGVEQVYEHTYTLNGEAKYLYDFIPGPHDGWGEGRPVFFAARPQVIVEAVRHQVKQAPPRTAGDPLSSESQEQLAEQVSGVLQSRELDEQDYRNMVSVFSGQGLPVKAITTGISGDGGAFIQGAIERGFVWNLNHDIIHSYTSMSLGIAPALGIAGNLTLGFWWGDTEETVLANMQGGSAYTVGSVVLGVGLAITIYFTMSQHPFGLVVSLRGGPEVEVVGGAGVAYTSFYERPPAAFPMGNPWG